MSSARTSRPVLKTLAFALGFPALASAKQTAEAPALRALGESMVFSGNHSCLSATALTRRIVRWLGQETVDARMDIAVQVTTAGPGSAVFSVRRPGAPNAVRRFDPLPTNCDDALAALSLSIALAIDSTVLERATVEAEAAPAAVAATPVFAPRSVGAEFGSAWNLSPAFHPLLGGVATVGRPGPWFGELGIFGGLEGTTSIGPAQGRFAALGARLRGCAAQSTVLALDACAGLSAIRIGAAGQGYPDDTAASAVTYGLSMRTGVNWTPQPAWRVHLAIEGWVPLSRPVFDVVDPQGKPVFEAQIPTFGVGLVLGASWVRR